MKSVLSSVVKIQIHVLLSILILLVIFSLFIWLHPTLGYVKSGFWEGMDLRAIIIQLFWIIFSIFGISSSLFLKVVPQKMKLRRRFIISYVLAIAIVIIAFPVIDRYL